MGVAQSDWQYNSYNGTSKFRSQGAFKDLRAVFSVNAEPVSIVARKESNIKTVADLVGKRVNISNPGSGTEATWVVMWDSMGHKNSDLKIAAQMKSAETPSALCYNKIDAFFWLVGNPSTLNKEAATTCDVVFANLDHPAIVAMLPFAAATQGFFLVRCKAWEIVALLLIAFTLFRPGYWMDQMYPPLFEAPAAGIYEVVKSLPENSQIRVRIVGIDFDEKKIDKIIMLPVGPNGEGKDRLANSAGLKLRNEGGKLIIDQVAFDGPADRQGLGELDTGEVANLIVSSGSPAKQWMYIPVLFIMFFVIMLQRRRKTSESSA